MIRLLMLKNDTVTTTVESPRYYSHVLYYMFKASRVSGKSIMCGSTSRNDNHQHNFICCIHGGKSMRILELT